MRVREAGKELLVEILKGVEKEALRGIRGVKVWFEEGCWITRLGVVKPESRGLDPKGKDFFLWIDI